MKSIYKTPKINGVERKYLSGGNLKEYLENAEVFSNSIWNIEKVKQFVDLALALSNDLEGVHAIDLFQGDIQPNDTAEAIIEENDTQIGDNLRYLPPERTGFVKVAGNTQSDLYSLGVSLYEFASGIELFNGSTAKEIVTLILSHIPQHLSSIIKDFPEQISDIIDKLIRKNPADRYQTAAGLSADLKICQIELAKNETPAFFALGKKDTFRELNYKIPMVGRQNELQYLTRLLTDAQNKKGNSVFIGAPSGTGKSRLASEFSTKARAQGFQIFSAKFSEYERNVPLGAIGWALQEYATWLRQQSTELKEIWKSKIAKALNLNGAIIAKRFSYLQNLLPVFPPLNKMSKDDETQLFYNSMAVLLTHLNINGSGNIIYLDDLQWADSESLKIVKELQNFESENNMQDTLFVGTYRNDEVLANHPLEINILRNIRSNQKIILAPLRVSESNQLVYNLIDESSSEVTKLAKTTFQLTRGNPFFTYEYLKSAISSGVFYFDKSESRWIFNSALAITSAMSRGALALVKNRIGKLPVHSRQTILIAGVLGNNIKMNHFQQVVSDSLLHLNQLESYVSDSKFPPEFEQWLDDDRNLNSDFFPLVCDKLIFEHLISKSSSHFSFFHDKIREAAYELLPLQARTPIHKCYGEILAIMLLNEEATGQKPSSKDIFEAAFHVMKGFAGTQSRIARDLLHLASIRAIDSFEIAKANEYLSFASTLFDRVLNTKDKTQWVKIHTSWADCLAISESIEDAITLCQEILLFVTDPLQKAEAYAKLADFHAQMFRHTESLEAGIKGLGLLNEKLIYKQTKGFIYALLMLPKFIIVVTYYNFFGKQTKEILTSRDEIKYRLRIALVKSLYFATPIASVANQLIFILELLFHKDSYYRNMMIHFCACPPAVVGLDKIGNKFFNSSLDFFEKYHSPVDKGYLYFNWGYVASFSTGNLKVAHVKIVKSLEILTTVEECFWRSLSLLAVIHIDHFGAGNGEAAAAANQIVAIWHKFQFEPGFAGCVLKEYLFKGKQLEFEEWMARCLTCVESMKKKGSLTLDTCFSNLAPGEIYLLQGDNKKALPLLKNAYSIHLRYTHRVSYASYSSALLATAYIRLHKPMKAIIPIFFAWVNVFLNVKIFKPQTWYVSGEFFAEIKCNLLSDFCFKRGISFAEKNCWFPIVAEGQLAFGKLLARRNSIYAEGLIQRAKAYFVEKGNLFLTQKCDESLRMAKMFDSNTEKKSKKINSGLFLKKKNLHLNKESSLLLNRFLKLSAITKLDSLMEAALKEFHALAQCEQAIVYLNHGGIFKAYNAIGLNIDDLQNSEHLKNTVDTHFIHDYMQSGKTSPEVQNGSDLKVAKNNSSSALIFAIAHKGHISGYCYLGHNSKNHEFDSDTIEILCIISSQVAISLHNISMIKNAQEKAEFNSEWKAIQAAQESLLPLRNQKIPQMAIAYRYYSASKTGGDWVTYYYNSRCDTVYLCVGDVTGHGFPSALITGVVCGAVFSCEFTSNVFNDKNAMTAEDHLVLIARSTNIAVLKTSVRSGKHVTMSFISINTKTGLACFINAGHIPPLWVHNDLKKTTSLMCQSNRLGYSEDSQFNVKSFQMLPGDSLCVFSDGLIENLSDSEECLNVKQIKNTLDSSLNPEDACDSIMEKAQNIWKDAKHEDDISLVVAKWEGVPGELILKSEDAA